MELLRRECGAGVKSGLKSRLDSQTDAEVFESTISKLHKVTHTCTQNAFYVGKMQYFCKVSQDV